MLVLVMIDLLTIVEMMTSLVGLAWERAKQHLASCPLVFAPAG